MRERIREIILQTCRQLGVHVEKALEHPRADADKRRIFQEKIEAHKKAGRPIV